MGTENIADKVKQIIVNLMDNAFKFTENGEVELKINIEAKNNHGVKVVRHFARKELQIKKRTPRLREWSLWPIAANLYT